MKKQGKRAVDNLFDFLEIIVMAMFVVVLVFTFVFRTVNVQGQSMQDTLFENDSLVISKLLYTPKQGDIVVVNSSVLDNRIIKRIIAVEGQKVEIDNKSAIVKVNGAVLDESYIKVRTVALMTSILMKDTITKKVKFMNMKCLRDVAL